VYLLNRRLKRTSSIRLWTPENTSSWVIHKRHGMWWCVMYV